MRDDALTTGESSQGPVYATDELLPLVYQELRRLAAKKLAQETPGQTLSATALVNEVYLRLVEVETPQRWDNPGHFFAAAAEAMRRILVEVARRKHAAKRGGGRCRVDLDAQEIATDSFGLDLLALDDALERLASERPVHAELVKLRYFAGLTSEQAAQALGISTTTADRYWSYARSWLRVELE